MDQFKTITRRDGVDVGYHNSPVNPPNNQYCVGKRGLDKTLSLEQIIDVAYNTYDSNKNRVNIIIKAEIGRAHV